MAKNKQKQAVCVIGLGYVGLPLAIRAAERGYDVYGLDTDRKKVRKINEGKSPFADEYVSGRIAKFKVKAATDKKIIIDGVNALDKEAIKKCGIIYKGIGR